MVSFTKGPVVVLTAVDGTPVVPVLLAFVVALEPLDPLELHAATASVSAATVVANRTCMSGILAGDRN
jgi:drug/metabolite transporter (DMT)-like permease